MTEGEDREDGKEDPVSVNDTSIFRTIQVPVTEGDAIA